MADDLYIGLDLGTSRCKAVAVDRAGQVAGKASRGVETVVARPGWAQQDVAAIWGHARAVLDEVIETVGRGRVAAIGVSGAMHTLVPVGEDDEPLGPATTWQDQRAAGVIDALSREVDAQALYERTGCPLLPHHHGPRLRWMLEHDRERFDRARRFVAIKDYIIFKLTGQWATDLGLASSTGLLDVRAMRWDEEALALAGIDASRLAPLASWARRLKSPSLGAPIVLGSSDGALANIGSGAGAVGATAISVGTSAAVRTVVDRPRMTKPARTWCYVLDRDRWLAGCALNNGGSALDHVREREYGDEPRDAGFATMFREAAAIAPADAKSNELLIVPFHTPERGVPWPATIRAQEHGLTPAHSRAHRARATMEGICYAIAGAFDRVASGDASEAQPVRVTGALMKQAMFRQMLADVLGVPLLAAPDADASARGAAWAARIAATGEGTLEACPPGGEAITITPDPHRHAHYRAARARWQTLVTADAAGAYFLTADD